MNVKAGVWKKLTMGERQSVLEFAASENAKRPLCKAARKKQIITRILSYLTRNRKEGK